MIKVTKFIEVAAYCCTRCGTQFQHEEDCLVHEQSCKRRPPKPPLYKVDDWVYYHGGRVGKILCWVFEPSGICESHDKPEGIFVYRVLPLFFEETGIRYADAEDIEQVAEHSITASFDPEEVTGAAKYLNKLVSLDTGILDRGNVEGFISHHSIKGPGMVIGLEVTIPLTTNKKVKKGKDNENHI